MRREETRVRCSASMRYGIETPHCILRQKWSHFWELNVFIKEQMMCLALCCLEGEYVSTR